MILDIHYPESQINPAYLKNNLTDILAVNVYTCMENHVENGKFTFGQSLCPGGEFSEGDADSQNFYVRLSDKIAPNSEINAPYFK